MRRVLSTSCTAWRCLAVGALLVVSGSASAQPSRPKIVLDEWSVAHLQGSRAGYVRTYVEGFEEKGNKLYRTTMALRLKGLRFGSIVDLGMETGTTETAEGKVVGTFMRQYLGKQKALEIIGTVMGREIQLVRDGGKPLKPAPWNDD